MLHRITNINDPLIKFIVDDPVRPEIPIEWRVSLNKEIFALVDDGDSPQAIVCVAYCDSIPKTVDELFAESLDPQNAIFYTIWSYNAGAGRQLIFQVQSYLKNTCEHIVRYVTLSPTTEMARRFHLKNGAVIFRENLETVNYEYK